MILTGLIPRSLLWIDGAGSEYEFWGAELRGDFFFGGEITR